MADNILKAEDLLTDEGFLAYYLKKDSADFAYWEGLKKDNPLQENEILKAFALMEMIILAEKPVSAEQQSKAYQRFISANSQTAVKEVNQRRIPALLRWSAAAAVLISIGIAFYFNTSQQKESIQTQFGEIKKEKLPDGTGVIINANSRISFSENWEESEKREVWMDGEVYFDVVKTAEKKPFIVHTAELDVEVTGTRFNVNRRSATNKVFLVEGSIVLHSKQTASTALAPGDYAELNTSGLAKKAATDAGFTAWIDRKFIFDKTSMAEVARSLEEIYGKTISFSDDQVSNKTISGILPNDNLTVLLDALEAAYGLSIVSKDKEIVIGSK
jgi:transmembrane sensor